MGGTRAYAVFGWLSWQLLSRIAEKRIRENRGKLGAAGIVAAVSVGGIVAARSGSE